MGTDDASIYSNIQTPPPINPFDNAERAMKLSQLSYQMQNQNAVRGAYAQNTDPQTGQLDRAGFLSSLGKTAPTAAMEYQSQFAQQDKQAADAKIAQMQSAHATLGLTVPRLSYLLNLPDDQAEKAYPNILAQWKQENVDTKNAPPSWDRQWAESGFKSGSQTKEVLANALTQAQTAETQSKIGQVGDQRLQALKDDLDPDKTRDTNLAKNQARFYSAQRLQGLLTQTGGNPDKRQMEELAIGAQNMLSNGNGSVEQVKNLVPSSIWGDGAKMYEWIKNDPTGTNQQLFVKRMGDTINREMQISSNQVKDTQVARAQAHQLLQKTNSRGYASVLHSWGIEPQNIQDGKYVPTSGLTTEQLTQAPKEQPGGVISSAYAAAPPPSSAPSQSRTQPKTPSPMASGLIRMQGPDGQIRRIPESQKGEAIAAGGKVVP